MIKTEPYSETLIRTYSDEHFKIIQDGTGVVYDDAIDPIDQHRTYTESEEYIDDFTPEVTLDDAMDALKELGVE